MNTSWPQVGLPPNLWSHSGRDFTSGNSPPSASPLPRFFPARLPVERGDRHRVCGSLARGSTYRGSPAARGTWSSGITSRGVCEISPFR